MATNAILTFVISLFLCNLQFSISGASEQIFQGATMRGGDLPLSASFENNLKAVLDTLASQASQTGFYHSTFGQSPDQVTAMYLCRGDLDGQDCSDCVTHLTNTILNVSNTEWGFANQMYNYTEVTLSYDHCTMRFSNESFIGKINVKEYSWSASLSHGNGTFWNKICFFHVLSETLNRLPVQAANDESGKRFASKVVNLSKFQSLYAIAQCTWDLTPSDCNKCLSTLTTKLLGMSASPGFSGRGESNNCMVRYENFPFFGNTVNNLPSSSISSVLALNAISTPTDFNAVPRPEDIEVI